jgi:aminotransferase EvaB
MTTIRTWDYRTEYEAEREDLLAAVDRVFRSGQLILGESVRAFEREFAGYCGVADGVGVGNATDGIFLTLRALGIGAGDEVVTVPNTAVPTVSAIVAAGATPRFVDIDPATYLMDVTKLEAAIGPRTRAILPVHLFGQCVNMEAVTALAKKHGLVVVEDCAQAHGATQNGRRAGSFSRAGVFSFYPTKPLGAYGDGGLIVSDDPDLIDRLRRLRFYGMQYTYIAQEDGFNSRLDEVQAEILRRKLTRLDGYIARRRALASAYDRLFAGTALRLPATLPGNGHVFHLYVVAHPERDRILDGLQREGIELTINYPQPVHLMRAYERLGYARGDFPATERAAAEVFSLPLYPSLDGDVQIRVREEIGRFLGG